MRQLLFFAGEAELAQNPRLLVGDGLAGGMKADVFAQKVVAQNAPPASVSGASSAEQIKCACEVTPCAVSRIIGMSTGKLLLKR